MVENFKYYVTLALTTFMGPADRGEESHAEYLRRCRDEKRALAGQLAAAPPLATGGQADLEYMR